MKLPLRDTEHTYGLVTRVLHWSMALVFGWQFLGMIVKITVGRSPLTALLVGTHKTAGLLLLTLALLRVLWALRNAQRRPAYGLAMNGKLAKLGHFALYALMLLIPSLALLRQFGSGKDFTVLGVTLMQETGIEVGWMVAPADLLHGILAWILLALILGHILMALVHRYYLKDQVFARMAGK